MITQTAAEREDHRRADTATGDEPLLVYVAGPYTRPDPVHNTHDVVRIADALLDAGFTPLVPHLTMLWHAISPKPYQRWLDYDRHLLARCDLLLRVPGESQGATLETRFAEEIGIPVVHARSKQPSDCVAALVSFLAEQWTESEPHVHCHGCDVVEPGCDDCRRCHVCCRCGGR